MKKERFIGIDPGETGGVAVLYKGSDELCFYKYDLPFGKIFDRVKIDPNKDVLALEKVGASPQMGVTSSFSFGRNYGTIIEAILDRNLNESCYVLLPQEWQAHFGKFSKERDKKKQELFLLAKELFPQATFPKYIADAVLMAKFMKDRYGVKTIGNRKLK